MPRYKLTLEYDGSRLAGWQIQDNGPSVQGHLEAAIKAFSGERVRVHAAGRTDAGVHALGMVTHFDLSRAFAPERVQGALNHYLRDTRIAVLAAEQVSMDFHARFSAVRRTYLYRIINRRAPLTLDRARAWHVIPELDAGAMHEAAQHLVGRHDFTTFRHAQCQAQSPVKTLDYLVVEREGNEIFVHTAARSFLHHQVRSMVGTLKLVGEGKWAPEDVKAALEARDRRALGFNAPPDGLYFVAADY
ncbi:MAG: tRNA pseudouridine(38-40) synthase TruA [Alphaproteobacteria bacterium]|nr:MAG: tRNA pseudouridine(38-40) synthase TruA [Alphaproteobacteria bacterium]